MFADGALTRAHSRPRYALGKRKPPDSSAETSLADSVHETYFAVLGRLRRRSPESHAPDHCEVSEHASGRVAVVAAVMTEKTGIENRIAKRSNRTHEQKLNAVAAKLKLRATIARAWKRKNEASV